MSHDTIADAAATLDRHRQAKRAPQGAPSAHAPSRGDRARLAGGVRVKLKTCASLEPALNDRF